jgi:hypothetical protein
LAVDGKTLRGIHGEEVPGVHLVAVYSPRKEVVLTQIAVGEKENELTATKQALAEVSLEDKIVTGDALQTQREIGKTVCEKGAIISSS